MYTFKSFIFLRMRVDFWNLIETEFRDLLVELSRGENLFREKYTDILDKIKNIEKRI